MAQARTTVRINKYLADQHYCSRREADAFITQGAVFINGRAAVLGDRVSPGDAVEIRVRARKPYRYYAYHKPRGIITHSPQGREEDIAMKIPLKGVFPVGRLDKDSYGLILLTDDGRIVDRLLNPEHEHEKEYVVTVAKDLRPSFKEHMKKGVDIGGYTTKPCAVEIVGPRSFHVTLTEGKKHQIRRMCAALHNDAIELKRIRIMNVCLADLPSGEWRTIEHAELRRLLASLGLENG